VELQLARLRELTAESESRVHGLRLREDALEAARDELDRVLRDDAKRRREETDRAVAAALQEFRALAKRELESIQDAKERARVEREQLRAEARVRASLREQRDAIAPGDPQRKAAAFAVVPGAAVRIVSLDREGAIVAVRGDRVDVRMGSATFTVAHDDLAPPGEPAAPAASPRKTSTRLAALAAASRHTRVDEPKDGPAIELHLLGRTVDEALPLLDRFLDESERSGRTEVRVVHGHGTGRLRLAVRAHLKGHPQVGSFRPGGAGEGGDGATVVTLR
jgi:DNA mismatch repair protein MutS2